MMNTLNISLLFPVRTSPQAILVLFVMIVESDKSTVSVMAVLFTKLAITPENPEFWFALGVPISLGIPNVYRANSSAVHLTTACVGSLRRHVNTTLSPGHGLSWPRP